MLTRPTQIGLILMTFILFFTACSQPKPVKIGYVAGLTGRVADQGIGGRNGAVLAVEELNAAGGIKGRPVELIVKDDASNLATVLQVDQQLIDAGVTAIVGHVISAAALVAVPLMNRTQTLMISPSVRTAQLTGREDYFFSLITPIAPAAEKQAEYAVNRMGIQRMITLYDLSNRQYGEDWTGAFKTAFIKRGGKISGELTWSSTEKTDYTQLCEQIKNSGAEGVLLVAGAIDSAMLCQYLRKSGSRIAIFTSSWPVTDEFTKLGGEAVNGVILSSPYYDGDSTPAFTAFKQKYAERFGILPNYTTVYAYDAVRMIAAALEINDDPQKMKETILKQKTFQSLVGPFELNGFGDTIRGNYLLTVRDGRFEKIE